MNTGPGPGRDTPESRQTNIARDHATQYIVQHGELHVHHGDPTYRVDEFHPSRPHLPVSVRRQPSRLLAARYQVVDFTGRDQELSRFTAWRDDAELGIAARLLHGPGGQGKTRLVARFGELSAELGWTVAHAVHHSYHTAPGAGLDPKEVARGRGLLLIVDYAERWPASDLMALAQDRLLHTRVPTRVLLVARPAGWWWGSLSHRLQDRLDMPAGVMALTALADTTAAREAVFIAARDRFAELLEVPDPGQCPPPARLDEPIFGLVLALHMAALVAVDAHAHGEIPPADPAALSAYLLGRERDHWQTMYDNKKEVLTPPAMMGRAVFTATLTRPLPHPAGVAALTRVGIPTPEQVLDDHGLCYPPADPATVCEPLYPDRLGEDFVALTMPGHRLDHYQPDPWADTATTQLLAPTLHTADEPRCPGYTPQAVTVLIETAHRWPHITCRLYPLLCDQPQLALAAGAAAVSRLTQLPNLDIMVLEAIEACLPEGRHLELDLVAAIISTPLTQHRLAATTDPAEQALLHIHHSSQLIGAGLYQQALLAGTQALEISRRLAAANPETLEPAVTLALTLQTQSWSLAIQKRRCEALDATTESVQIYRRLVANDPAHFEPPLAKGLESLGNRLSVLGRRQEALDATTEGVQIYRRLAGADASRFEPDLAKGLKSLGDRLSELGRRRRQEALDATTESVQIYRRLATADPALEPDLAEGLKSLGDRLSELGRRRRQEALDATTETVDIYRRLATADPARFEPHLAKALTDLGVLAKLRRRREALDATTEAVDIYRRLATGNPIRFEPHLATALNILGVTLWNIGLRKEALDVTIERVDIRRRLATANPTRFERHLAWALNHLGVRLCHMRLPQEALDATTESVQIYRRLATADPALEPDLAKALINHSAVLAKLRRRREALDATTEAAQIRRRVAKASRAR